jgi:hypothetical protein
MNSRARTGLIALAMLPCFIVAGTVSFFIGNIIDFETTHADSYFIVDRYLVGALIAGGVSFVACWLLGTRLSGSHRRSSAGLLPTLSALAAVGAAANHFDFTLVLIGGLAVLVPIGFVSAGSLRPAVIDEEDAAKRGPINRQPGN